MLLNQHSQLIKSRLTVSELTQVVYNYRDILPLKLLIKVIRWSLFQGVLTILKHNVISKMTFNKVDFILLSQ